MPGNRFFRSLAVLATVVLFALPNGSAFAKPIVELDHGSTKSAASGSALTGSRAPTAAREGYYAVKMAQSELAAGDVRLPGKPRQAGARISVASARLNRYAAFKEQQIQQIMDRE